MVLEVMSHVSGFRTGAMWVTTACPRYGKIDEPDVLEIAKHAPMPPKQYDDPYSSERVRATVPLMSIPAGRWMRELRQFFDGAFDSVEYVDPFIQNVLAPAHRAYGLHLEGAPLPQVQRAIGEIASQDWMVACLLYTTSKCTPPTE